MTTPAEPREPREYRVPALIDPPSRSIVWIATWILIGLVATTLLVAAGPGAVELDPTNWTAFRGYRLWLSVPIVAFLAVIIISVGAVRRARPYREQQASAEGQALQHDMDVALAAKPRIALNIIGVILTVVFAVVFVFVLLGLATGKVDAAGIDIEAIALFLVGIPAAGTLGVARRRHASARRLASEAGFAPCQTN